MTFEKIIDFIPVKPYYREEDLVIYNADCREVLPLIPDKSIDLVIIWLPISKYYFGAFSRFWYYISGSQRTGQKVHRHRDRGEVLRNR